MTRTVIVDVLVALGVLLLLICSAGVLTMRSAYDRLHYANASSWGALLVGVGILVRESWSLIGDKALLIGLLLTACSPIVVHATARAGRIRENGAWNASREERRR
jgi:monovalent cation/proton antiporter MnhG/PhaG subunit